MDPQSRRSTLSRGALGPTERRRHRGLTEKSVRPLIFVATMATLLGCTTIQSIVETQELLKDFQPPQGLTFTSVDVTRDGNNHQAGDTLVQYKGGQTESPDIWSSVLATIFDNKVERWVDDYEVWTGDQATYRVRVIQEVSRPDNEEEEGVSALSVRLEVTGPEGKVIRVDRLASTNHDRYLRFGAPLNVTVSFYYNGLPRRGGWSDFLRTPTALLVEKKRRIVGLITEREPRRLLLGESSPEVSLALMIADLEFNADHWE